MKVQNRVDRKKIGELVCDGAMKFVQNFAVEINGERVAEYLSLDAVAKDWEDYKPAKPYIKEERARKVVRDWATLNKIEKAYIKNYDSAWFKIIGHDENGCLWTIEIHADYLGTVRKDYDGDEVATIELCGEEEE